MMHLIGVQERMELMIRFLPRAGSSMPITDMGLLLEGQISKAVEGEFCLGLQFKMCTRQLNRGLR